MPQWITDSGDASTIADNRAVEPYRCQAEGGHAGKRSRFLLTAPPLRRPGAVGSPATPVATG